MGGRVVFAVIRRTLTPPGQVRPPPEVAVPSGGTSRSAASAEGVQRYPEQGRGEPFHADRKSALDLERWPAGTVAPHALVRRLGRRAYNRLRLGGQTARPPAGRRPGAHRPVRPHPIQRRRRRRVLVDLIYPAARIVHHARRLGLVVGGHPPWGGPWPRPYGRFGAT